MPESHPELEAILERIRKTRNFDFRNYKRATLHRRIVVRMKERGLESADEYQALIDREPEEIDALINRLLIKVTSFFRDPALWETFARKVLPDLLNNKRAGEEVRIWSAGCATGEEPFTIAMLVAEALGTSFATFPVKIFGTDVDEGAIAMARRAVYSSQQVQGLPKPLIAKYLQQGPEGFTVRKELRRAVVFGANNLVSDAPISRLDFIVCRNVFIYLDNLLQQRVLARFHYALRRNGVLMLGKSELIPFASKIFEPVDLGARIYRKDQRREAPLAAQERLVGLLEQENISRLTTTEGLGVVDQFYRDVLDSSALPTIATSLDGTVTLWTRSASLLWKRSEVDVLGKKLSALGLPGLSGDLLIEKTAAIREGRSERESSDSSLTVPTQNAPISIRVELTPLRDESREVVGLLYVVQDTSVLRNLEGDLRRANAEVLMVNEKLQSSVEELRSSNEELETTNEELQSANEELQTTNEELQSTNEELETTNEELQSTNAELDATNRELAHRTEELNLISFYQRTILRSLSAAVVVLDPHGRISTWNLAAERLLGVPEREAIGQSVWTLRIPALGRGQLQRMRRALNADRALRDEQVAYELPTGGRGWATMAAIPLFEEDQALGAVILFEDTTRATDLARASQARKKASPAPKSKPPAAKKKSATRSRAKPPRR